MFFQRFSMFTHFLASPSLSLFTPMIAHYRDGCMYTLLFWCNVDQGLLYYYFFFYFLRCFCGRDSYNSMAICVLVNISLLPCSSLGPWDWFWLVSCGKWLVLLWDWSIESLQVCHGALWSSVEEPCGGAFITGSLNGYMEWGCLFLSALC